MIAKSTTIDDLYEQTQGMLFKLCKKWCSQSGCDWDTALEAANIGFMEAYERYDSSKGAKFSTYLHQIVRNVLRETVCTSRKRTRLGLQINERYRETCADNTEELLQNVVQKHSLLGDLYGSIGEDGKKVLDVILEDSDFFKKITRKNSVVNVRQVLMERTGLSFEVFLATFDEIKSVLKGT